MARFARSPFARLFRRPEHSHPRPSHRRRTHLGIETVEDRVLPAVNLVGGTTWLADGPVPIIQGQSENIASTGPGVNAVNGAINTLALHPTNPNIAYLGSVDGGVWRTTNFTATNPTYTPLTDQFPGTAIGALAFDPTDVTYKTLVAGIGQFNSLTSGPGVRTTQLTGLLRTTDGGDTWNQLGVADLTGVNVTGVAAHGNTILVTGNTLSGGVNAGVYRSTNGGGSFALLSGTNGLGAGPVADLFVDPTNVNRVYVGVTGVGIFRNDNFGSGTWVNVSAGDATLNTRVTSASNNNIEIGVSPETGRVFTALSVGGTLRYIGFSDNAGGSWTQMDLPVTSDTEGTFTTSPVEEDEEEEAGGQGNIHFSLVVDPTDDDIVYIGGDRQPDNFPNGANSLGALDYSGRLFRGDAGVAAANPGSTAVVGSAQWASLTHTQNAVFAGGGTASNSAPHADSRDMAFRADGVLIEVDDGGVYGRSSPRTNTGDWFSKLSNGAGGLSVAGMHDIAYDSVSHIIISGNQDTGTTQQVSTGSTTWTSVPFSPAIPNGSFGPITFARGDGGDVAVDSLVGGGQSVRYFSFNSLGLFTRQVYNSAGALVSQAQPALTGLPAGGRQFVTPIAVDEVAGGRLIIGLSTGVYESTNRGDNFTQVGTVGANRTAISYGAFTNGVANPDALYVGSGAAVFGRTGPGNLTATAALPAGAGTVTAVRMNPNDANTVAAVDSNQVFLSTNAGGSWADVTGNLVDANLRSIVYVPGAGGTDAILVGGAGGVFRMLTSQPGVWVEFGTGLPNAVVYDMAYSRTDDLLVVGTLGRGAFSVPAISTAAFSSQSRSLQITGDADFAGQNDVIRVVRDPGNPAFVDVFVNGVQSGPYQLDLLDQIVVGGLGGNDTLIIDSTNGLITVPGGIHYDGGTGFNNLVLTQTGGTTQTTDTYTVGPNNGDATSVIVGPGGTQSVFANNIAPAQDDVPAASAVVNGTAAANAINYAQGPGGGIFAGNTGLVTVDNFESFEFNNKTNLVINGRAGADDINLNYQSTTNPAGLTGTITVNGNDPAGGAAGDTLTVNGINGALDNLRYLPTAAAAGTIVNDSAPQPNVLFTGIEHLSAVVRASDGDGLRLDGTAGNDAFEFVHGLTSDAGSFVGTMDQNNATGGGPFAMTPLSYTGANPLANDLDVNFFNPGGTDSFVFDGTGNDDAVVVQGGQAGGTNFGNTLNGIQVSSLEVFNIATGLVKALGGNDTVTVNSPAGPGGVALRVEGGDGANVLTYTAPGGSAATVDLGASSVAAAGGNTTTFAGVGALNVNANGGALTVNATAGNDALTYTPTGAAAGTVTLAGAATAVNFTNAAGTVTLDPLGGSDTVTVLGTAGNDTITVVRGAATTVTVAGLKAVALTTANTESLTVAAGAGDDVIAVSGAGGPAALLVDAGTQNTPTSFDVVTVTNTGAGTTTVVPGATPDAGSVVSPDGTVAFAGTEFVNITGTGAADTLVGRGTNAADTIATQFLGGANRFWVNAQAVVSFANFGTLTLAGLFGADAFSVSPVGMIGLTTINVVGGDPTATDTVVFNGSAASDVIGFTPTAVDGGSIAVAGAPTTVLTTVEALTINGQGGGDVLTVTTPAGADAIALTPGAATDAGTVRVGLLLPVKFGTLGAGLLTLANTGGTRQDSLTYTGTPLNDTFSINALGTIVLNGQIPVGAPGVASVRLDSGTGDDRFALTGGYGYTSVALDGADPSASDVVDLTGNGAAVTVNLTAPPSVTGGGLGTVSLTGAETLNLDAGAGAITVNGSAGNDQFTATPTGAAAVTVTNAGVNTVLNVTTTGTLTIDPLGGNNTVTVNGTAGDDVITAAAAGANAAVAVNALKVVDAVAANTQSLTILGLTGNDNFTAHVNTGTNVVADGGAGTDFLLVPEFVAGLAALPNGNLGAPPEVAYFHFEGIRVHDVPVAVDDPVNALLEDGTLAVAVLANDLQVGDVPLSVTVVTGPANGTAVVNPDLSITYTPNPDYNGPDSLVYRVLDANGEGSTATITFQVIAVNDPPTVTVPLLSQPALEDAVLTLSDAAGNAIHVGDVDALAGDVTVTLSVNDGRLSLARSAGLVAVAVTPDGHTLTLTGTLANVNTALGLGVTYATDLKKFAHDPMTVTVTDNGNTGLGGPLFAFSALDIAVSPDLSKHLFAVGTAAGGGPEVRVLNGNERIVNDVFAYDPQFRGGVSVALGDINGDGVPDMVTGAGFGGAPAVAVIDGATGDMIRTFYAYEESFRNGVSVAVGDVTGDGVPDIIAGAGPGGGPHVTVFDGKTGALVRSFYAFDPGVRNGVHIGVADVDGDGVDEILAGAGFGGGPQVAVFSGLDGSLVRSFFALDPAFRGGVNVAGGDINGDGIDDIIVGAGPGGGAPHVTVFDGKTGALVRSFYVFDPAYRGGVSVAAADLNGDGVDDIIAGATGDGNSRLKVVDGVTNLEIHNFYPYDPGYNGGIYVG